MLPAITHVDLASKTHQFLRTFRSLTNICAVEGAVAGWALVRWYEAKVRGAVVGAVVD